MVRFRLLALAAIGAVVMVMGLDLGARGQAFGCVGGVLDVAQPVVGPEGIKVSIVSYSLNCLPTLLIPGYEICFIGNPNCIPLDDPPGGSANLNSANFLGITATIDSFHIKTSHLLGDTLHAIIDLSAMKPVTPELERQLLGFPVDEAVGATVEAVLVTAYLHHDAIADPDTGLVEANYLWLEIRGAPRYQNLGGVFPFSSLGPHPRYLRYGK
ncbi:MAG: hypothetical protein WAW06_11670 [bacterium]